MIMSTVWDVLSAIHVLLVEVLQVGNMLRFADFAVGVCF